MISLEALEGFLPEALARLYDPVYRPPAWLWDMVGLDPRQSVETLQETLIREIEALKPSNNVPQNARIRRVYGVLSLIYVRGLTQEEAAERLNITPRHLRRERPEAVHVLALRLWERHQERGQPTALKHAIESGPSGTQSEEWRSQVREELAALQESGPSRTVDLQSVIDTTCQLASRLTAPRGIDLQVGVLQANLVVKVHPSLLRQVLITAIQQLVHHMTAGQITIRAERQESHILIAITGHPAVAHGDLDGPLVREIVDMLGGSVEISVDGDLISFWIELPPAQQTILVVDDNVDTAHLYRRFMAGTPYTVVHVAQGQRTFEMIESSRPDLIILDIMLPDVDGWELLAHLREHPETQSIPVLVCSVVREKELALALGADDYLTKPVQRPLFLQTVDELLSQTAA
jgi:CheY-like chemotaxis protein